MFIKFRKDCDGPGVSDAHGGIECKVVPSESVIFETPYVRYTKKPCPVENMQGPCRIVFEDPTAVEGEYLEVVIIDHLGEELWLYAAASGSRVGFRHSMFIMNDDGKTVDSISCG